MLSASQKPMLAKLVRELPAGDVLYEPKWDGFRCLVFRDEAAVELRHPAKFVRWRPDREPRSCRIAQLEEPGAIPDQLLAARGAPRA